MVLTFTFANLSKEDSVNADSAASRGSAVNTVDMHFLLHQLAPDLRGA